MKIFNYVFAIRDRENHIVSLEQIERLDEMLNEYEIPHAFTEYHESQDDDVTCNLFCMEENIIEVQAIGLLWSKKCRGFNDEEMKGLMKRIAIHYYEG